MMIVSECPPELEKPKLDVHIFDLIGLYSKNLIFGNRLTFGQENCKKSVMYFILGQILWGIRR